MGKASSNKKVARAAKAGGGRARAAGERNLLFPAALAIVVVLGTLLVVYARENRSAEALEPPLLSDHWHSAYGIYVCDEFQPSLPEFTAPQNGGTHTHGDGLIHIHPFSSARAGENATLENWLQDAGAVLGNDGGIDDDSLAVPGGETFEEGESECEGVEGDPIVQVAIWDSYQAAVDGEDPSVVTEDVDSVRFARDGQAYTIAFAPEDAEIPPPPTASEVAGASPDLGVPQDEIPAEAEQPGAAEPSEPSDGGSAEETPAAGSSTTAPSTTGADTGS
jgi:hypothetical protein